jgi:hypothetical protein
MAIDINIPIEDAVTDGSLNPVTSNAVFDALATKANSADLGATAFSNDYNDLDNLPTIPSVTGFVPYTGATTDLDMGTHNVTADHISLNVSPSGAGFGVGSTQWNNTSGSSETLLKGGNVTLKNGVDLVARIVNKVSPNTTLTKANYQAVRVSGAQGGRLAVNLAQANNDNNSADTIGLVTETIATNQEGFIITVGQLLDINTTGSLQGETWADGDVLYLSPTTAGKLTNIKPTGSTGHIVVIGYVEYAHATQGAIYVKIMNGWELDELHNVSITSVANNDLLQYDSVSGLWKNESLSTAGVQPTLVSGTNIKTVNGTSLLGSGDITIGGGGLTVGTTAIASGTVGRILFQGTGNVLQQDSALAWDNTLKRLTLRAVGASGTDIPFRVRNSADAADLFILNGNKAFNLGGGVSGDGFTTYLGSQTGVTQVTASGNGLVMTSNFFTTLNGTNQTAIQTNGVTRIHLDVGGNVGIGSATTLGARLDVRAQGALSTDIAFRVRNSADTANIASIQGDGSATFGTYTNPNTRLTVTGTTIGSYISGNTGIYAASNVTSGTLYAIDCLGRALNGANTSFGIRATSDTAGVGSTNYGGRFNAYNGTTNYAGYFDSTGGTTNYALYIQRGDILLGTATTNKIGLWNATPIVQPTTAITASTFVTNTSGILNDSATFDGYTIGQVVKALRNLGILA